MITAFMMLWTSWPRSSRYLDESRFVNRTCSPSRRRLVGDGRWCCCRWRGVLGRLTELRVVLAHELSHVQQRHFPSWALAQLPLAAHYYHPLVHWLVRRLRLEHELVADSLAATVFGNRVQYATVLAGLALHATAPRGPFTPLGVFMSRPLLMRRIAMLHQTTENSRRTSRVAKAILSLMILGRAAIMAAGTSAANAADEKRPESGRQMIGCRFKRKRQHRSDFRGIKTSRHRRTQRQSGSLPSSKSCGNRTTDRQTARPLVTTHGKSIGTPRSLFSTAPWYGGQH